MSSDEPRLRFLLDHDVDTAVGAMLRRHGHEAWTATLATRTDLWVRISADGMDTSSEWT